MSGHPYERVVVPCDGQPDATTVAVATGVAARLCVPVVLFSLVGAGFEARDQAELQRFAAKIGPDVRTAVRTDDGRATAEQLAEVADEPGTLLCLRTRAESAIAEALFRSIGEDVIRASTQHVLVIGPHCVPEFCGTTMLVAVDPDFIDEPVDELDELGTRALAAALTLTPEFVTIVRPGRDDTETGDSSTTPPSPPGGTTFVLERTRTREAPALALARMSERADVALIAAETSNTGILDRLVSGSTTLSLIRHSVCPVLTRGLGKRQH